jgi:hypothetical protein
MAAAAGGKVRQRICWKRFVAFVKQPLRDAEAELDTAIFDPAQSRAGQTPRSPQR